MRDGLSIIFPDGKLEFWTGAELSIHANLNPPEKRVLPPGNGSMTDPDWLTEFCTLPNKEYCVLTEDYRRRHATQRFTQPVLLTLAQMVHLADIGGVRGSVGIDLKTLCYLQGELQGLLESHYLKNRRDHNGRHFMPNMLSRERIYAIRDIIAAGGLDSFLDQHWGEWIVEVFVPAPPPESKYVLRELPFKSKVNV